VIGIAGLAWGTVVGGCLHILIQVPALISYGFRYAPKLHLKLAGVREILRLMGPRIIMLGSVQLVDLVIIFLASGDPGSQAGYFYAYTLMQLPETLIGTAIGIVAFPTMAELYNAGKIQDLKRTSMSVLRIIWTLTIPAAVGMVILGEPLIDFFLGGGAFDSQSVRIVYSALTFFSFRVVSEASIEILARLFYAQHDTKTPMYVALIWLLINVTLAFPLDALMGIRGLALASTIAFTIQAIILFVLNRIRLGNLDEEVLLAGAARSLFGAALMAITIMLIGRLIDHRTLYLLLGGGSGVFVYFLTTYLVGGREIPTLINLIKARQTA
jgi:putative peptidoglycan lipid II flippase